MTNSCCNYHVQSRTKHVNWSSSHVVTIWKMFDVSICWEFQHPSDSYFSDGVGSTTNQLKYEMIPTCCSLGGEPPLNHASSRLIFAHPPAELLQESPSFVIGSKATWMNWRIWMDLVVGQHWCNWCMHPGMHRFFALVFYPPLWQCRLLWHQIPCKTEKNMSLIPRFFFGMHCYNIIGYIRNHYVYSCLFW